MPAYLHKKHIENKIYSDWLLAAKTPKSDEAHNEKYQKFKYNLKNYIKDNLETEIRNISVREFYTIQNIISETEGLSSRIEKILESAIQYNCENEIIKGIIETIRIKIKVLKEERLEFIKKSNTSLEVNFQTDEIADDLFAAICAQMPSESSNNSYISRKQFIERLLEEAKKSEEYTQFMLKISQKWQKNFGKMSKFIYNFKRDVLFYELSLFDEILKHSVEFLRNINDEKIRLFVSNIDSCNAKITKEISKNGTERIEPSPHTPFNSAEHEIIIAEINKNFPKGQIIKTLNPGYKDTNQIFIRASVVVAR